MFERYTEKARRVVFFARHEARQLGSPLIETEHLLLGLLREEEILKNHADLIRKRIEKGRLLEKLSDSVDIPLSNESKQVLCYAVEESNESQHLDTRHILLGLLRASNSLASTILHELGLK